MKHFLVVLILVVAAPAVSLCQLPAQDVRAKFVSETTVESVPLSDSLGREKKPPLKTQASPSRMREDTDAPGNQTVPEDKPASRFWASAEYLLWKMKKSALPPLISVGPASGDAVIGQPGTVVVFGGNKLDRGKFPGARFTAGMWLNKTRNIGVELSYFFLKTRTVRFQVSSNGQPGSQTISRLFVDVFSSRESILIVAFPNFGASGTVTATSPSQLRGAEANFIFKVKESRRNPVSILAGFRDLDLSEKLTITDVTDVDNGAHSTDTDQFATRNQFYGGQAGVRYGPSRGRFSLALSGSIAIGVNRESVDIDGAFSNNHILPFNQPGGLLALISNIGRYHRSEFTVAPQLRASVDYRITRVVRAFVGYDFFYWNRVVRPGNEIDRVVNGNLVPRFATPFPQSPLRPAFTFNDTAFWAQGLTAGVKLQF